MNSPQEIEDAQARKDFAKMAQKELDRQFHIKWAELHNAVAVFDEHGELDHFVPLEVAK